MLRSLLVTILLAAPVLAQQPSQEQQCQMKCSQAMQPCLMACMGSDPASASKPENRGKTQACVKGCATKHAPCLNACKPDKPERNKGT